MIFDEAEASNKTQIKSKINQSTKSEYQAES